MSEVHGREGETVGSRFTLKSRLGTGGFGAVWLARDLNAADGDVALKLLHPRHRANNRIVERFVREARLLEQLDHPNIARAVGWSVQGLHAFIAMEFVGGEPLDVVIAEHHKRSEPFTLAEIEEVLRELTQAVGYAHSKSVVHRDLKPKNVMIERVAGRLAVKVLDFGLAKILDETAGDGTTVGRVFGSLLYMSPEQAKGLVADHRTDIFAIGAMLFELLTLRKAWARDANGQPLPAAGQLIRREPPNDHTSVLGRLSSGPRPRPSEWRPGIGGAIDRVVARALDPDPERRFATVFDLAGAFSAAIREPSDGADAPMVSPMELEPSSSVPDTIVAPRNLATQGEVPSPLAEPFDLTRTKTPTRIGVDPAAMTKTAPLVVDPAEGRGGLVDTTGDVASRSVPPTRTKVRSQRRKKPFATIGLALSLLGAAVVITGGVLLVTRSQEPLGGLEQPEPRSPSAASPSVAASAAAPAADATGDAAPGSAEQPAGPSDEDGARPAAERPEPARGAEHARPPKPGTKANVKSPGPTSPRPRPAPAPTPAPAPEPPSPVLASLAAIGRDLAAAKKTEPVDFKLANEAGERMLKIVEGLPEGTAKTTLKRCIRTSLMPTDAGELESCLEKLKVEARSR